MHKLKTPIMNKLTPKKLTNSGLKIFEQNKRIDDSGNEFWTARDLAKILEYSEYRHFLPVVAKAQESCENSKIKTSDHFEEFLEMIDLPKGARRELINIKLSRYACYLIVQNSDPTKEVVALGQSYFAVQTRLQEIQKMEEFNKLSSEDEKRLFLLLKEKIAKNLSNLFLMIFVTSCFGGYRDSAVDARIYRKISKKCNSEVYLEECRDRYFSEMTKNKDGKIIIDEEGNKIRDENGKILVPKSYQEKSFFGKILIWLDQNIDAMGNY
jgi:hypothetical protein